MQAVAQLHGAWRYFDIGDDAAKVAGAECRIGNLNGRMRYVNVLQGKRPVGHGHGQVEGKGNLAGKTDNREAVSPVGSDVYVKDVLVQIQRIDKLVAGFKSIRQDQYAVMVLAEAHFAL